MVWNLQFTPYGFKKIETVSFSIQFNRQMKIVKIFNENNDEIIKLLSKLRLNEILKKIWGHTMIPDWL